MNHCKMKFYVILFVLYINQVKSQRYINVSPLDIFAAPYRQLRKITHDIGGKISEDPVNLAKARSLNILQKQVPLSVKFPCNVTGFRSLKPPSNVNEVKPGDIDIIAAMGDSLTTGNGLVATNPLHVWKENRGLSWCIGGQGTWREYLTLPNILKEFNPNLFGYSLTDSVGHERATQFNIAEVGTVSSELPYMAKILIQRIKADPRVDLKNHWKLVTLMIGANNFCYDICYHPNPEDILKDHKKDLLNAFRLIKKNLPRTIINLVPAPDPDEVIRDLDNKPLHCQLMNRFECFCMLQAQYQHLVPKFRKIIEKWQQLEEEIANMEEFNTKDFTIIYQPCTVNLKFPRTSDNKLDLTYLSQDCFHMSQKLNAEVANALWNNMMEKPGMKTTTVSRLFEKFLCPSDNEPYFMFRKMNSTF